jgi:hypothetical protein
MIILDDDDDDNNNNAIEGLNHPTFSFVVFEVFNQG